MGMEVGTGSASEARGRSLRTLNRRLVGLIFLIGGLGLAKWQIYDPLHARELGRKEVWIDAKLVGLAIILPALGALFLVFGERVEGLLRSGWLDIDTGALCWRNVVVILTLALGLGAVCVWERMRLAAQGYR